MDRTISVVIPSYLRHFEVQRAVRSALEQTLGPDEVIVCNDGPEKKKGAILREIGDLRVKFFEAPRTGTASATRNFAISKVTSSWVALLDDDDVWDKFKLQKQMRLLDSSGLEAALIAGAEEVLSQDGNTHIRTVKFDKFDYEMGDVIFARSGGIHTSTILAPTSYFKKFQFDETMKRHEDWSWLLRVGAELPLMFEHTIVCRRYLSKGESLSRPGGFEYTKNWYQEHKDFLSRRAKAGLVSKILSRKAAHDGNIKAIPWLLRELRTLKAGPATFARFLLPWVVPNVVRSTFKKIFGAF